MGSLVCSKDRLSVLRLNSGKTPELAPNHTKLPDDRRILNYLLAFAVI